MRKIIKSIDRESREASRCLEKNTRTQLRGAVLNLRNLSSQLMTQNAQTLLQTLGGKGAGEEEEPKADLQNEDLVKELELARKEIALLEKENQSLKEQLQMKAGVVTSDMLDKVKNYEDFRAIEGLTWPKGAFKAAFPAAGFPLGANKDTDIVVLHEEGELGDLDMRNRQLEHTFNERYPDLKDLEGKVSAITVNTRAIKKGELNQTSSERWVIKTELVDGEKDWFEALTQIRELLVEGERKKILVYPPSSDIRGSKTRRILECVFRSTKIKCLLHTRETAEGQPATQREQLGGPNSKTEALVVRSEGKSYADLLKAVKQTVKPGTKASGAIRTIREGKNGGMVVVLDRATEDKGDLQGKLERIEGIEIRAARDRNVATVFIHDLDGLTTKEEILEAVKEAVEMPETGITVGEPRRGYGGVQTATIRIPKEKAGILLKLGRIRVGLCSCPIKEKVDVPKCFRCWKYGHQARDCSEETDDSDLCRRCGGKGHEAKGCGAEVFCITCKAAGHMAGSGGCPEFKKALKAEKAKLRARRW